MTMRPQGLLLDAMGTLIGLRQSVGESYAMVAEQHVDQRGSGDVEQGVPAPVSPSPSPGLPGHQRGSSANS